MANHIAEALGEVTTWFVPSRASCIGIVTVHAAVVLLALYGLAHLVGAVR
jgi:hypothetical protein